MSNINNNYSSPLLRISGKAGLIMGELLMSLPQLSCTSESLLTSKYTRQFNFCKFNIQNIAVGLIRLILILSRINFFRQRDIDYSKILCISHAVVNNTEKNDFYYGSHDVLKKYLADDVDFVYILHDKFGCVNDRYYINNNISTVDFFKLLFAYIQGLILAAGMITRANASPMRKYLAYCLVRGDGLETIVRVNGIRNLIKKSPADMHLRALLTIEGHAWEKMIISVMRKSGKFSCIYGYAHSAIRKSTTWIKYRNNKLLTPDVIFFPNQIYLEYFRKIIKSNSLTTILYPSQKPKLSKFCGVNKLNGHSILLLPEGLPEEENLFMQFAHQLYDYFPGLKISIKWHPNHFSRGCKFNGEHNFKYDPDETYTEIIYRGSYAVLDFLESGARLFYLAINDSPDTNPIFMVPERFKCIKKADDFLSAITRTTVPT